MSKQKNEIKVALDLDGVIWDLVNPWVNQYNKLYNDNVSYEDITEYNLSKSLTKASYDEIKDIIHNKFFWNLVHPFEYSEEYLYKINNDFDLYIATATNYKLAKIKIELFLKLFSFMHKEQIICVYNKSLLNVDWLVDDCIDNLIDGNFNKIILDAPYNRTLSNKECKNFIRAKNLKEVYDIINTGECKL